MLRELSLFTGYVGMTLGLRLAGLDVRTVAYVEIDPYCQAIIQQRIQDGFIDDAPIFPDIRAFDGRQCRGVVDIITAGFPCQPHSSAGKRKGKSDERNLWPDTLRVVREVEPRYILLENVRGLVDGSNPYSAEILGQLSEAGYDAIWGLVPAAAVGAPHLRWRWWCLAYSLSKGSQRWSEVLNVRNQCAAGESSMDSQSRRYSWWLSEPGMGRVADGVAHRVDRLKALGNGVVPAVVKRFLLG